LHRSTYAMLMSYALEITDLRKKYSGVLALDQISLRVRDGSFLALLGKNGAGKTTLIGIISSLIQKTSGKILVFDYDFDKNSDDIKPLLGIMPQEFNLSAFQKVIDVLINQAGYYGVPRATAKDNAYKYLTLLDLWNKHDQQVRSLSGGMKRRLMLARALIHEPKILFLDEPTAGVDVEIRAKIWQFLSNLHQNEKKTIILTTHYLEEAERLCDTVAIIEKGNIVLQDDMKRVLAKISDYSITMIIDRGNASKEDILKLHKNIKFIDDNTIEVSINNTDKSLNKVLQSLMALGVNIKTIRNNESSLNYFFNTPN